MKMLATVKAIGIEPVNIRFETPMRQFPTSIIREINPNVPKPVFDLLTKAATAIPVMNTFDDELDITINVKLLGCVRVCTEAMNKPEVNDFTTGLQTEAAYQKTQWEDNGKTPEDWRNLLAHLSLKAIDAIIDGNIDKAKHHMISTAAVCANWHAHITKENP